MSDHSRDARLSTLLEAVCEATDTYLGFDDKILPGTGGDNLYDPERLPGLKPGVPLHDAVNAWIAELDTTGQSGIGSLPGDGPRLWNNLLRVSRRSGATNDAVAVQALNQWAEYLRALRYGMAGPLAQDEVQDQQAVAKKGEGGAPTTTGTPDRPSRHDPDQPYADLRRFACAELKGLERAVIEALCDAGGELPIADLAVKSGAAWDDPVRGFANTQRRLKKKLSRQGWTLTRQNNAAMLRAKKAPKPR